MYCKSKNQIPSLDGSKCLVIPLSSPQWLILCPLNGKWFCNGGLPSGYVNIAMENDH